jgi:F-type H+-transporting ATPase subunit delta
MKALVESAVKLDDKQLKELSALLKKKIGSEVTLTNQVKPEILGGLRVTLGSRRIDVSLLGKLAQVKKQLE